MLGPSVVVTCVSTGLSLMLDMRVRVLLGTLVTKPLALYLGLSIRTGASLTLSVLYTVSIMGLGAQQVASAEVCVRVHLLLLSRLWTLVPSLVYLGPLENVLVYLFYFEHLCSVLSRLVESGLLLPLLSVPSAWTVWTPVLVCLWGECVCRVLRDVRSLL